MDWSVGNAAAFSITSGTRTGPHRRDLSTSDAASTKVMRSPRRLGQSSPQVTTTLLASEWPDQPYCSLVREKVNVRPVIQTYETGKVGDTIYNCDAAAVAASP